jgi:hypothetical protein
MLAVIEDEQRPLVAYGADEELARRDAGSLGHVERGGDSLGEEVRISEWGEVDPTDPAE